MPLLLLSKSQPLRWVVIWFGCEPEGGSIYTVAMFHVGAKFALLRRLFMPMAKKPSSARSLAPPLQTAPASLGCDLVLRVEMPRRCTDLVRQLERLLPPLHIVYLSHGLPS